MLSVSEKAEVASGFAEKAERVYENRSKFLGVQVVIVGVNVVLIAACFRPGVFFTYHPVLMMLGYTLLMCEGMVTGAMARSSERKIWLQRHFWGNILAQGAILGGFAVISFNKYLLGKAHFTSWHSWFGLFSMVCCFLQVICGVVIYFSAQAVVRKFGVVTLKFFKRTHWWLARTCQLTGALAIVLGFQSHWAIGVLGISRQYFSVFSFLLLAGSTFVGTSLFSLSPIRGTNGSPTHS